MYLTERERQQEQKHKQGEWEREKQALHLSRKPDAGLHPRTPGS